jgi:hypothetical protein
MIAPAEAHATDHPNIQSLRFASQECCSDQGYLPGDGKAHALQAEKQTDSQ